MRGGGLAVVGGSDWCARVESYIGWVRRILYPTLVAVFAAGGNGNAKDSSFMRGVPK